eukprot:2203133-Rhodomonas_salina.1
MLGLEARLGRDSTVGDARTRHASSRAIMLTEATLTQTGTAHGSLPPLHVHEPEVTRYVPATAKEIVTGGRTGAWTEGWGPVEMVQENERVAALELSLIHISEPTRPRLI